MRYGLEKLEEISWRLRELSFLELCPVLRHLCLAFILGSSLNLVHLSAQTFPDLLEAGVSPIGMPAIKPNVRPQRLRAAAELKEEERQRILGVMPNFNTSMINDAEPLDSGQKLDLAAKGLFDPFTFAATGLDAGLSQIENNFPAYRQGGVGYSKRFGASYADNLTSTMIGNALIPVLLKQDPRYFRKGTGSFASRLWYALLSAVECKDDNGKWVPNYSNVLGNIAAGGISNLYYPATDRGVALTFQRATTITVEGAIGSAFFEFWPDISRKIFPKHSAESVR